MQLRQLMVGAFIGLLLFSSMTSTGSVIQHIESSNTSQQADHFYSTYEELTELLTELQVQYPDIFAFYSLAKTYQGRDIWVVKISDYVLVNESEPQILYLGGVHGNERPGFQAVIYSLRAIVENYTTPTVNESFTSRIRQIVNSTELYFIPMVNPDGIEAFTRKNCKPNNCLFGDNKLRGVDINRNYDYNWEDAVIHPFRYIIFPQSLKQLLILVFGKTGNYPFERTSIRFPLFDFSSWVGLGYYRGPYPFSENESSAIRNFLERKKVTISVDYHSYGEKVIYPQPWRYTHPTDNRTFFSLAQNVSSINGYTIRENMNWSNISGNYGCWAYTTRGMYPLTIELCDSKDVYQNPNEEELLHLFFTHLLVNLYLAETIPLVQHL